MKIESQMATSKVMIFTESKKQSQGKAFGLAVLPPKKIFNAMIHHFVADHFILRAIILRRLDTRPMRNEGPGQR